MQRLPGGVGVQSQAAASVKWVSGVFNTSRQLGGALAVAVFGALLAGRAHVTEGLRESLLIAALVAFAAAAANLRPRAASRAGRAGGTPP